MSSKRAGTEDSKRGSYGNIDNTGSARSHEPLDNPPMSHDGSQHPVDEDDDESGSVMSDGSTQSRRAFRINNIMRQENETMANVSDSMLKKLSGENA